MPPNPLQADTLRRAARTLGQMGVTTEYAPQSRFCVQKFGASSQTSHASAIVSLCGADAATNYRCSHPLVFLPCSPRAVPSQTSRPIGVNDMHIAACARGEGLVLVTNNIGVSARVPALEAENWVHAAQ